MGITKTSGFSETQLKFGELFKVLGHPARMAIVEYLVNSPSCVCGDIVEEIPLAQSTISRHLKELKNANIIQGTVEGNNICYCLNENTINEISSLIDSFGKKIKENKCC